MLFRLVVVITSVNSICLNLQKFIGDIFVRVQLKKHADSRAEPTLLKKYKTLQTIAAAS